MNKEEIEKKLKASSNNFVPNNLNLVMQSCKDIKPQQPNKNKRTMKLAVAFSLSAIILMLFFGVYFNLTYNQKYDTLIFEINPSIELIVNQYDRVIDVNVLNQDAEGYFDNERFENKKIYDAINYYIATMKENNFFSNEDNEIYLTLVSNHANSQTRLNKFEEKTNHFLEQNNVNKQAKCNRIEENEYSQIKNLNLTPAKYKLIQKIIELDSQYTIENLSQMTLSQLRQLYRTLNNAN